MASPVRDCFPSTTILQPLPARAGAVRVEDAGPQTQPGDGLRRLRRRLGLTTRKVAESSQEIARGQNNAEFAISHARLVQLENGGSAPGIHKLFSLSPIYGVPMTDLIALYVKVEAPARLHLAMGHPVTHLMALDNLHEPGLLYGFIGLSDVS